MTGPTELSNPFPGLRSFGPEEEHLFFGREQIVDQLLMRLRETRFLGVIGTSGCGKSSLVRAGVIPSLHGGYMVRAGSSWRVAVIRPGTDPLGNLAKAMSQPKILGRQSSPEERTLVLTEVTLGRGDMGLVDHVRLARLPPEDNLLIVVDQFEELFRFKRSRQSEGARDEAVAFVKKLLSAAHQSELPIYIVLTMRSDFIGECNEYPGLPEAINEGQFLVPRMSRDQLRSAICGPILVAGGQIAPRLQVRLLNDVGDNPDRLPILQHALMRTWNYWQQSRAGDEPIDIQHYEAIGTIDHALSSHADEAYEDLESDHARGIAATIFKALTDTTSDSRGIRRPTSVGQLSLIAEASIPDVTEIIDVFRRTERSFLMPPIDVPLKHKTIVDISHESLMRVWERLIGWTRDEAASAQTYLRLSRTAARYEQGIGGLWHDPDLAIALDWRDETQPTQAWAIRYDPAYEQAMSFLDKSKAEKDREVAEKRSERRKKLQTAWGVSVALLVFALYAFFQQQRAEQEQHRALQNFELAVRSVDEMLNDVAIEASLADVPQTEQLRQRLLEKARMFFEQLRQDPSADPSLRLEMALAQRRLGNIYESQGLREKAEAAHLLGILQLRDLVEEFADQPIYRYRLGEAYNWYGEQLRPYDSLRAEAAYDTALELQTSLVDKYPEDPEHRYELGRTYNNRGILVSNQADRADEAEQSFNAAIKIFESLRDERGMPLDTLRLARTKNSLAKLLRANGRHTDAQRIFDEAINLQTELSNAEPDRREYREGLARMYNNLSNLHLMQKNDESALRANTEARRLYEDLAAPIHGLQNEIANSYNTRGRILAGLQRSDEALQAYQTALRQFEQLEQDLIGFENDPDLNSRYGNAHANLAILYTKEARFDDAERQVSRAITYFENAVNSPAPSSDYSRNLASAYWLLADIRLDSGNYAEAIDAVESSAKSALGNATIYAAALLYVRATDLAIDDEALTAAERGQIVESYAERTVALLGAAIEAGYPLDQFEADVERRFVHLQDRIDFRQLSGNAKEE